MPTVLASAVLAASDGKAAAVLLPGLVDGSVRGALGLARGLTGTFDETGALVKGELKGITWRHAILNPYGLNSRPLAALPFSDSPDNSLVRVAPLCGATRSRRKTAEVIA